MRPERYKQIDEIFQAALDRPPQDRADFLDHLCGDDLELRKEVEALLSSDEQAGGLIESPAFELVPDLISDRLSLSLVGRTVGPYRVNAQLGSGGMGEVYLAEDSRLGRRVALKLLGHSLIGDAGSRARFLREARLASVLDHPNICTIHEVGEDAGLHYMAMQYVEGVTLKETISGQPLALDRLLSVSLQVADALREAHSQGIIHRDIKPGNIIITPRGQAKVLDFGLARPLQKEQVHDELTQTGSVLGTPAYMSPEQGRGERSDARSDIFSLGTVMYEMATGRMPFKEKSHAETMNAVINHPHPPATELNKELPSDLSRIIDRALAKQPDDRYQAVEEVITDLQEAARTAGFVVSNSSPPIMVGYATSHARSATRWRSGAIEGRSRRIVLSLVAGLVLVSASAFVVYRVLKNRSPRVPFQNVAFKQLTTNGRGTLAALAPDGKLFAYVSSSRGQESMLLGHLDGGEPVELRPLADVKHYSLTFSPDGSSVYYVVVGAEYPTGALCKIPVFGGVPERLRENIRAKAAFAPDMKQFVYTRVDSYSKVSSLVVAKTDGSSERELVSRPENLPFRFTSPSWSPDGKTIAVGAVTEEGGASYEVFLVSVADGQIRQLTALDWHVIVSTVWLPDSSGLVVVAREKEEWQDTQLWRVSCADGSASRIVSDLDTYGASISTSSDGQSLSAVQGQRILNVWVAPAARLGQAKQVTFGSIGRRDGLDNLDWTPDGRLLYGAVVKEGVTIWTMEADGNNQKQLTSAGHYDANLSLSDDGRYMVFDSNRSGEKEIWRAGLDGSALKQLTTGGNNAFPHVSPDGTWVVYTSLRDGLRTIWRVSIDGGQPVRLGDKHAVWPRISPDGRLIACGYEARPDSRMQLAILPIDGGRPLKVFDLARNANSNLILRWTPDGKAVTYRDEVNGIWRQSLEGGKPQRLEGLPEEKIFYYGWSKDGTQFAYVRGGIYDVVLIKDLR